VDINLFEVYLRGEEKKKEGEEVVRDVANLRTRKKK